MKWGSIAALSFAVGVSFAATDKVSSDRSTELSLRAWVKAKVNIVEGRYEVVRPPSGERCLSSGRLSFSPEQDGQYLTLSLDHHVLSYGLGQKPYVNQELFQGCSLQVAVSETELGLSVLQSRNCGAAATTTKQVLQKEANGFRLQNYRKKQDGEWEMWIDCTYRKISERPEP